MAAAFFTRGVMDPRTACVSDDELRAFLVGELPDESGRLVVAHLETCPACQGRASRLDGEADPLLRSLRRVLCANPQATHDTADDCGAAVVAEPGWRGVPGYEVLAELGRGGMGVVYQARQASPARLVALKMLLSGAHAGPDRRARFRVEADAIARLQHPNIVQIHEVGFADGVPFFSMELLEGGALSDRLEKKPQPPDFAAGLVEALARAAHYAHQRGVVHRDLKPSNVLLSADGTPKLADFGLARLQQDEAAAPLTASNAVLGTPSYAAPEQAAGGSRSAGPAVDVYSLGAILYEMLTGRPPFQAATPTETILEVLSSEPVAPRRLAPGVPRDLETVCLKCLEKDPQKRYASAQVLADDLRRWLNREPICARPLGPTGRLWR